MIVATSTIVNAENIKKTDQYDQYIPASPFYLSRNHQDSNDNSSPREYTFQAPNNSAAIDPTPQSTTNQGYKVEVYGSAEELLQQVRDIEPKAFIKGNIIQVGIFGRQDNAEDLVRKLAIEGFWARIVVQ
ncbi:MAG: SPOR domain-containing protein [Pleurocapsa sp. MO_192.B19]|nr:SPOR domain-containing protein [Pleurocapsa sp. MO_192.B19]